MKVKCMSNKSEMENNNGVAVAENGGTINVGLLTLEGLRPYIEEVVKCELEKYKNKALVTALERDGEFVLSVFNKLNQLDTKIEKVQEALSSPSMQFDLIEAEKGYIKTGSVSLLDILGELIAERVNCKEATIGQIVLSEAIKTAPILLDKQLDILALRFFMDLACVPDARSLSELHQILVSVALPLCQNVSSINDLDIGHLDFTRCSIKSIVSNPLCDVLWNNYTSAFYIPFSSNLFKMEQINGKSLYEWFPEIFAFGERDTFTFKANNYSEFLQQVNDRTNVTEPVKKRMVSFYKEHCVPQNKAANHLIDKYPDLKPISDMWNKGASSISLSSIGIAIGAIHLKNKTSLKFDLSDWIQ